MYITIKNSKIQLKFRDFSLQNENLFLSNIDLEYARFNGYHTDANIFAENVVYFLKNLQNKYFPIKSKIISMKRLELPWITSDVKKCINKKHRWYRMVKNKIITMSCYKSYCTLLRKVLRTAEKDYNAKKLQNLGSDIRKNWKLLNKLLGKTKKNVSDNFLIENEICTDHSIISEAFNKYFIEHPKNIQNSIQDPSINFSNLINFSRDSMFFRGCNVVEISNEIYKMKKRGKLSDISSKFLKISVEKVSPLLCRLFNSCIRTGKFPECFKIASITPIFKKGNASLIPNHRPISVLPTLSKLFEAIIFHRIKDFFESKNLLNPNQYGFRRNRSTELAIFSMIDRVSGAFEDQCYSICIFLDFSACFDTISRSILFSKLYNYGVRGVPLDLIKSYFSRRNQFVAYGNSKSSIMRQDIGVIQGSKCGPLYYDIYTGDIRKICSENEYQMFADDTSIYVMQDRIWRL